MVLLWMARTGHAPPPCICGGVSAVGRGGGDACPLLVCLDGAAVLTVCECWYPQATHAPPEKVKNRGRCNIYYKRCDQRLSPDDGPYEVI